MTRSNIQFKWIAFTLIFMLLSAGSVHAASASRQLSLEFAPIHFTFDGTAYTPSSDEQAFLYQDHTYVPLRFISYALDYAVQWDNASQTVTITEPSAREKVQINQYKINHQIRDAVPAAKVNSKADFGKTVHADFTQVTYMFLGKAVSPANDLPGFMYKDHIFVPMRFFADAIGKKIAWDNTTYTVSVTPAAITAPTHSNTEKAASTPGSAASEPAGNTGTSDTNSSSSNNGITTVNAPSYQTVLNETDQQISALKAKAEASFNQLLQQYNSATDSTKQANLIAQGKASLSQYDQQFNRIMTTLQSELTSDGYSTDVVQKYKDEYTQAKQDAMTQALLQVVGK